jgi:hypothetical protein
MADRICVWLGEGESLRSLCLQDGTPNYSTVYDWMDANPSFAVKYARARDKGLDVMAEETVDESSVLSRPAEQIPAARALDARKWYLSKIAPKRYGDRIEAARIGPVAGFLSADWPVRRLAARQIT